MTWIVTSSGKEIDLLNPNPELITIEDLAFAIHKINRFTGHTSEPYSVLDHSIECMNYANYFGWSSEIQLACLAHDLHEALIGDVSTPVKLAVPAFRDFEAIVEQAVHKALGISAVMCRCKGQVKQADLALLLAERNQFIPFTTPWFVDALVTEPYPYESVDCDYSVHQFMDLYNTISEEACNES